VQRRGEGFPMGRRPNELNPAERHRTRQQAV
jgi:hypothetical protein